MPRPQKYGNHKLEAYRLYQQRKAKGEDVSALDIQVELEELHPEGTASYRLIADWIREFKRQDERQALLDSPFHWHLMEQCGLPWEASSFLMTMLGEVTQSVTEASETHDTSLPGWRPTFRDAIWWWRVHQAAPEITDLLDIQWWANSLAFREMVHELLGWPLVMADLEACLTLKPWLDDEHHDAYHKAVDLGVVPPLRGWDGRTSLEGVGHPELLLSQQSKTHVEEGEGDNG